jgi:hypothetical protein
MAVLLGVGNQARFAGRRVLEEDMLHMRDDKDQRIVSKILALIKEWSGWVKV